MKTFATVLMSGCLVLSAGGAFAAAHTEMKKDHMAKDGMKHPMTMQECKDHMAMMKKDGMKKDDAMMKKDTMCSDMMKSGDTMKSGDAMKSGDMMKKDGMAASAPMKK